jgi:hypothetical protein
MTEAELDQAVLELEEEDSIFVPLAIEEEREWVDSCTSDYLNHKGPPSDFHAQVLRCRLKTGLSLLEAESVVKRTYIFVGEAHG